MSDKERKLLGLWAEFVPTISAWEHRDDKLLLVMEHFPELRTSAWRQLLQPAQVKFQDALWRIEHGLENVDERYKPSGVTLVKIMKRFPELRQRAWETFNLHWLPWSEDTKYSVQQMLLDIICDVPELLEEAWSIALKNLRKATKRPMSRSIATEEFLVKIISKCPACAQRAWTVLKKLPIEDSTDPTAFAYRILHVVEHCPSFRKRAWKMLLPLADKDILVNVVRSVPELRQEAWQRIPLQELNDLDLINIREEVPELAEKATRLRFENNPILRQMMEIRENNQ